MEIFGSILSQKSGSQKDNQASIFGCLGSRGCEDA